MPDAQTPFQTLQDIDRLCRSLAAGLPSQQAVVQTWSGIGFRMGERFFVAPMGEVGEVLHEPRHTLLPGVKSWVKGVANLRGRLLPIMDLCGFFGHELSPLRKQRRVLVVEHGDVFAGLMVDEVIGLQHFEQNSFEPISISKRQGSKAEFVKGYFRREQNWRVFSLFALAKSPVFMSVAI